MESNRDPSNTTEEQQQSRELLVNFCKNNDYTIANTTFRKPTQKKCTFKKWDREPGPPWNQEKYREIDWILVNNRGENSITDIETDTQANISSDHFPVLWKSKLKLSKPETSTERNTRYNIPNEEQAKQLTEQCKE